MHHYYGTDTFSDEKRSDLNPRIDFSSAPRVMPMKSVLIHIHEERVKTRTQANDKKKDGAGARDGREVTDGWYLIDHWRQGCCDKGGAMMIE